MRDLSMINDDTIVAPATAPGEGGIGIVRLSGPGAEKLYLSFSAPGVFANVLIPIFYIMGSLRMKPENPSMK